MTRQNAAHFDINDVFLSSYLFCLKNYDQAETIFCLSTYRRLGTA